LVRTGFCTLKKNLIEGKVLEWTIDEAGASFKNIEDRGLITI
jgi:hypothetical protein